MRCRSGSRRDDRLLAGLAAAGLRVIPAVDDLVSAAGAGQLVGDRLALVVGLQLLNLAAARAAVVDGDGAARGRDGDVGPKSARVPVGQNTQHRFPPTSRVRVPRDCA